MARVRSTTFVGSPPRDVVGDASIFSRWMRAAVGDVALITDLVTGANATTPITHTGAGNGCQLRLPLAAQHIDRSLIMRGSTIPEQGVYVVAVPVFIPAGEQDRYRVTVVMRMPLGVDAFATVLNAAGTVTVSQIAGVVTETGNETTSTGASRVSRLQAVVWDIAFTATGLHYLLISRTCFFDDADPDGRLISWTMDRSGSALTSQDGNGLSLNGGGGAISDPYLAPATFTPSTVHDTYDEEIGVGGPLSAYVLTRLNRHINALWEYVTGSLIPGNATYQNATTWNNNRSSFTAEGLLDFPMCIVALGSILDDTGKPSVNDYATNSPTDGVLDWLMHPTSHVPTTSFSTVVMVCPSFSASSSTLKCAVLIHTPGGPLEGANWRFSTSSSAGASAAVAPVAIGGTNFLVATITAVPFTPSVTNTFNVRVAHTGAPAALTEEIDILGLVFYFDP